MPALESDIKIIPVQRIQVERLMVSVAAFVATVDLIALRGKMTDVARREWQRSIVPA